VASVDANNQQAYFSNSGTGLNLAAPGVGVITAWGTNLLASASGTSQSSALVSGAAAAYIGWGVPAADVATQLKTDARNVGESISQVGAGVLYIKPPAGR
jgi:subtilisin family serine protease